MTETETMVQDPNAVAMSGGLPNMEMPQTQETAPAETATQTTPPSQKYVIGDRVFDSSEAALAYANGLSEAQSKMAAQMNTQAPATSTPEKKRLGTLLFEDPDQALQAVQDQAVERIRAEQKIAAENTKFWQDFYSKHSDLVGSELLVDAVLGREQAMDSLKGLSREQAAPILAAKARQEVLKIRNVPSGGQALPSKPAMVAGASGAPTQQPTAAKPVTTNFVSELQSMRKKG